MSVTLAIVEPRALPAIVEAEADAAGCGCCAPRRLSADDAGMKSTASRPRMLGS